MDPYLERNDRLSAALSAPSSDGPLPRVLIVHPDPIRANRVAATLMQLGYNALGADSPHKAWQEVVRTTEPQILFVDVIERPELLVERVEQLRGSARGGCVVIASAGRMSHEAGGLEGCDILIGRTYNDAEMTIAIHRAIALLKAGVDPVERARAMDRAAEPGTPPQALPQPGSLQEGLRRTLLRPDA